MKVFYVVLHLLVFDKPMEVRALYAMTLSDCEFGRLMVMKAYEMNKPTTFKLILSECKPGMEPRPHR